MFSVSKSRTLCLLVTGGLSYSFQATIQSPCELSSDQLKDFDFALGKVENAFRCCIGIAQWPPGRLAATIYEFLKIHGLPVAQVSLYEPVGDTYYDYCPKEEPDVVFNCSITLDSGPVGEALEDFLKEFGDQPLVAGPVYEWKENASLKRILNPSYMNGDPHQVQRYQEYRRDLISGAIMVGAPQGDSLWTPEQYLKENVVGIYAVGHVFAF